MVGRTSGGDLRPGGGPVPTGGPTLLSLNSREDVLFLKTGVGVVPTSTRVTPPGLDVLRYVTWGPVGLTYVGR